MIKKLNVKLLSTTIITLLPILLGLTNTPNYKISIIIGIPIILAIINVMVNAYINVLDKSKNNISVNIYYLRWVMPVSSIVILSIILFKSSTIESPIYYIIMSLVGVYLCSSGVKLIDCKDMTNKNYKNIPSLFMKKDVSASKFDFIGIIWIISGLLFNTLVYLKVNWIFMIMILVLIMYVTPLLAFKFLGDKVK